LDFDIDPKEQEELLGVKNIDAGEAVLLIAGMRFAEFLFATGDKRFLIAFANAPACAPYRDHFSGKILCFEQIIRRILNQFDFDPLKAKIVPARECDQALKAAFGSGHYAARTAVASALESYIASLKSDAPSLLVED
jgi:hypothetical protein